MTKKSKLGVYALVSDRKNILVIKKARGPYKKHWDLPGGTIEFGETPEEALKRELKEEAGVTLKKGEVLCVLSNITNGKNKAGELEQTHRIGIIYNCKCKDPDNIKNGPDGKDSLGAKWIPKKELKDLKLTPFAKKVI